MSKAKNTKSISVSAIFSFVIAIMSFFFVWIPVGGAVLSLVAIVVGFVSMRKCGRNPALSGKWLAFAAILIGIITLFIGGAATFAIILLSKVNDAGSNGVGFLQQIQTSDALPVLPSQEVCGNAVCGQGESCSTCPADCGTCCGDGVCGTDESCSTCRLDCGTCCGDGVCGTGESCSSCPDDCGQCAPPKSKEPFKSFDNTDPYYSDFCTKITPFDLSVRKAAADAIRNNPGSYSTAQLFDVYDWVKANVVYQSSPLRGIPYPATETLATGSGDCKNQAVLIVSMIKAIGGTARFVADPACEHAYAIVRFGPAGQDIQWFVDLVASHYGTNVRVEYITNNEGLWVIFDPAGGKYPGNTLYECAGSRTVYFVDSCMLCVNQNPDMPYTFRDSCYSECPRGTIHRNSYSCSPCPSGYWSYNNACVTCKSGSSLHTDGRCYPN